MDLGINGPALNTFVAPRTGLFTEDGVGFLIRTSSFSGLFSAGYPYALLAILFHFRLFTLLFILEYPVPHYHYALCNISHY
jgi:hypothetical protein